MNSLTVNLLNATMTKKSQGFLHCEHCNAALIYLNFNQCQYAFVNFVCRCGAYGYAEIYRSSPIAVPEDAGQLFHDKSNRFCCLADTLPLFNPISENLDTLAYNVVCQCGIGYKGGVKFT